MGKGLRIWQRRGVMPIAVVLGFCVLGVLAQYLPGATVKVLSSAVASLMPGKKPQSQAVWLVPGSIYDGDTLRVTRGGQELKVRLCGIDAPELEQDMGLESRDHLRSLVTQGDGSIGVVTVEKDQYKGTVADLFVVKSDGLEIHLNSQMLMDGMAYHYEKYSSSCPQSNVLAKAEEIAKAQSAGVWMTPNAEKPWAYRRRSP